MGMCLDAGAHPGLMGALKSPSAAPPLTFALGPAGDRAVRCTFNLVHVAGWLVVALFLLAFDLSVLAASQPPWLVACCLVIALLLMAFGHSVWVVCQSLCLLTFTLVPVTAAALGEERTLLFSFVLVRSCLDWLPLALCGFWVFGLSCCG